ncbi:MAG: hypothetical protein DHS20C16_17980 [Phycisphaerae bacterium]|nr:MAG: hypothetical protein DHS20C16_17980 [Phycisphaerae bacterium]
MPNGPILEDGHKRDLAWCESSEAGNNATRAVGRVNCDLTLPARLARIEQYSKWFDSVVWADSMDMAPALASPVKTGPF